MDEIDVCASLRKVCARKSQRCATHTANNRLTFRCADPRPAIPAFIGLGDFNKTSQIKLIEENMKTKPELAVRHNSIENISKDSEQIAALNDLIH